MAPIPKASAAQLPFAGLEMRKLRSDPCAAYEAAKRAIHETIRDGIRGLDLAGYGLTELPEEIAKLYELKVSFDFRGCAHLTKLPTGFQAKGSVLLDNCTDLTALPEGMSVGGGLWLTKSV